VEKALPFQDGEQRHRLERSEERQPLPRREAFHSGHDGLEGFAALGEDRSNVECLEFESHGSLL
jgi:hypothetical protein